MPQTTRQVDAMPATGTAPAPGRLARLRNGALAALAVLSLVTSFTAHTASTDPAAIDSELLEKLSQTMAGDDESIDRFDAEVWLVVSDQRLERFIDDHEDRLALLHLVYREARRQNLDPDLVLAVMQVESHFNRYAISRVGAQGLMQIMPFWRDELGRPQDNLILADTNVRYGTTILAHYLERADGDLVDALARYNGSRGRLDYPELVISAWRRVWHNKPTSELPQLISGCTSYALKACRYQ